MTTQSRPKTKQPGISRAWLAVIWSLLPIVGCSHAPYVDALDENGVDAGPEVTRPVKYEAGEGGPVGSAGEGGDRAETGMGAGHEPDGGEAASVSADGSKPMEASADDDGSDGIGGFPGASDAFSMTASDSEDGSPEDASVASGGSTMQAPPPAPGPPASAQTTLTPGTPEYDQCYTAFVLCTTVMEFADCALSAEAQGCIPVGIGECADRVRDCLRTPAGIANPAMCHAMVQDCEHSPLPTGAIASAPVLPTPLPDTAEDVQCFVSIALCFAFKGFLQCAHEFEGQACLPAGVAACVEQAQDCTRMDPAATPTCDIEALACLCAIPEFANGFEAPGALSPCS